MATSNPTSAITRSISTTLLHSTPSLTSAPTLSLTLCTLLLRSSTHLRTPSAITISAPPPPGTTLPHPPSPPTPPAPLVHSTSTAIALSTAAIRSSTTTSLGPSTTTVDAVE